MKNPNASSAITHFASKLKKKSITLPSKNHQASQKALGINTNAQIPSMPG